MTRRNYFMKSISIIFMLLAMMFSCEPENENNDSNNSGNNTTQNGNNTGNTGEDNKDDVVTTGKIVGKATYTNTANHAGIQVTLVSSDGIVAYDSQISSRSRSTIAVMKNVVTSESGEYSFTNVKEGVYTIYASSDDSTEKAVLTNVVVQANKVVTTADLNLTATGSISGKVTLDGKENGNLGIMVFVASTSYMSMTDDSGNFTIFDIPAGADYQIVIMKGDYCTIWSKVSVEAGKENNLGDKNITSQSSDDKNYSFIWQGSSATPPANPEKYWAYFDTDDGCSYIYDGEKWTLLAQAGKDGANGTGGGSVVKNITTEALIAVISYSRSSCTLVVTGEMRTEIFSNMCEALRDNTVALINLDLSGTTGLTEIPEEAFFICESLESLIIPDTVTTIGNGAFSNCMNLTAFTVSENNKNYSVSDDGKILYNKDKTELISCCPAVTGDITIPDSVTTIDMYAFNGCLNLTSVIIPDSVTSIGANAFYDCRSLISVRISDSVTSIDYSVFRNCSSLTSVIIPDSVTTIGDFAFQGCYNLGSIKIGNSVTSIGENAFQSCYSGNLTDIIIPESVTFIGKGAFTNSLIKNITFEDTSTWYYTSDEAYTGSTTKFDVTDPVYNAECLTATSDYWYERYWYKE